MSVLGFLLSGLLLTSSCDKESVIEFPELSIMDISISESNEDINLEAIINLSSAVDFDLSFEVASEGGTANSEDYSPVDTIIVVSAGTAQVSIPITIYGDEIVEPTEYFYLFLKDPFRATILTDRAVVEIQNDDVHEFRIPTTGYISSDSYDGMELIWEENFDGEDINEEYWTFDIGDGCDQGICGWGNNELQYYLKENTSIVDGNLVIEAKRESRGGKNYTSSKLITKNKQTFKFGRIDIRAVSPKGKGMWPALWLLGQNISEVGWPACGEIDIFEMIGGGENDQITHGTVHWSNGGSYASFGGEKKIESGILNDNFHVYSIIWDESKIQWLIDDTPYHEIDITSQDLSEFREEFYLIINLAVGGNWPGSPDQTTLFPQWFIVDYIKYFSKT